MSALLPRLLLLLLVWFVAPSHPVELKDNRYEEIAVSLTDDLDIAQGPELVRALQKRFQEASAVLCSATEGLVSFGTLNVLVPRHWQDLSDLVQQDPNISEKPLTKTPRRPRPVVRVDSGRTNDVLQQEGCGKQGEYIRVSNHSVHEESEGFDKLLVALWSRWRYGVFPEESPGFHFHPEQNTFVPNSCTDKPLIWTIKNSQNESEECDPYYEVKETCTVVAENEDNPETTSSLLYQPTFPNMTKFCSSETHNPYGNTPQNLLCNGKSTWDVIRAHEDFKTMDQNNITEDRCSKLEPVKVALVKQNCKTYHIILAINNLTHEDIDYISTSFMTVFSTMAEKRDKFQIYYFHQRILNGSFYFPEYIESEFEILKNTSQESDCVSCALETILMSLNGTDDTCEINLMLITNSKSVTDITSKPPLPTTPPEPTDSTSPTKGSSSTNPSSPTEETSNSNPTTTPMENTSNLNSTSPTDETSSSNPTSSTKEDLISNSTPKTEETSKPTSNTEETSREPETTSPSINKNATSNASVALIQSKNLTVQSEFASNTTNTSISILKESKRQPGANSNKSQVPIDLVNEETAINDSKDLEKTTISQSSATDTTEKPIIERLQDFKVQIDTVAVGNEADSALEEFAAKTKGRAFHIQSLNQQAVPSLQTAMLSFLQNDDQNTIVSLYNKFTTSTKTITDHINIEDKFEKIYLLVRYRTPTHEEPALFQHLSGNQTSTYSCKSLQNKLVDICRLDHPEKGVWVLVVRQASPAEISINIVGKKEGENGPVFTRAWMQREVYKVDLLENVFLLFGEVQLQSEELVSKVEVQGILRNDNGENFTVVLEDSGMGPDITKGDGIYTGLVMRCQEEGRHSVEILINGYEKGDSDPLFTRLFNVGSVIFTNCGTNRLLTNFPVRDFSVLSVNTSEHTAEVTWTEVWTNDTTVADYEIVALPDWSVNPSGWKANGTSLRSLTVTEVNSVLHEVVPLANFSSGSNIQFLALLITDTANISQISNVIAVSTNRTIEPPTTVSAATPTTGQEGSTTANGSTPETSVKTSQSTLASPTPTTDSLHDDRDEQESQSSSKATVAGVVAAVVLLALFASGGLVYYIFYYRRRVRPDSSFSVAYANLD